MESAGAQVPEDSDNTGFWIVVGLVLDRLGLVVKKKPFQVQIQKTSEKAALLAEM
jgi:hypothetical protein